MHYLQNLEISSFFMGRLMHIKEKIGPNKRKWLYINKKKIRSERRLQINGKKQQHKEKKRLRNFSWSWTRIRYRRWWEMISKSNLEHSEMQVLPILTKYLQDPKLETLKLP
jgi:hypothetical protein